MTYYSEFKNPDSEFISFGHPLFEALLEWVSRNYLISLQKGATFKDPSGTYDGVIWFFEGEVKDGKGEVAGKRLLAICSHGNELNEVNPAVIWDLVPSDTHKPAEPNLSKEQVQKHAVNAVEKYKKTILEERRRQGEVKKKYGIKSLEYLIGELDADLSSLIDRQAIGEKVDIVIRNKEERKKQYEEALKALRKEIEQEMSLTISMPKFLGAILIKPEIVDDMSSDEEIERIGMETAIKYENSQGRHPEDVSAENLGFDVRSKGKDELRYIEVKARNQEGNIVLTPNEWFKAKRFKKQYWLYVVANASSKPILYLINNPAESLEVHERIEVVRFLVPLDEWKRKGVRA